MKFIGKNFIWHWQWISEFKNKNRKKTTCNKTYLIVLKKRKLLFLVNPPTKKPFEKTKTHSAHQSQSNTWKDQAKEEEKEPNSVQQLTTVKELSISAPSQKNPKIIILVNHWLHPKSNQTIQIRCHSGTICWEITTLGVKTLFRWGT